jgi:thioredoxin reductase (NADPH)
MATTIYDIAVIGGGPIGLFSAATAGELGALCLLLESRLHLGGLMMAAYPRKDVYNFPGIVSIRGSDLVDNLITKAVSNGMISRLGEYVNKMAPGSRKTVVIRTNRHEYMSSTAIITTGLKAFYSPFNDYIKIDNWEGAGIYESWPPVYAVKDKVVCVFAGTAEELNVPNHIRDAAREIIMVIDETWINILDLKVVSSGNAGIRVIQKPWAIDGIVGEKVPECLIMRNSDTGAKLEIALDVAVGFYTGQARQTVYSGFGIDMIGQQIRVDQRMQTTLKRVFAAGDIAWYPGKIMALSAGIYEANIAVKNALKLL